MGLAPDGKTPLIPNAYAPAEPVPAGPGDLDPYHVPVAFTTVSGGTIQPTSLEFFFPVSAPNRPRSLYLLRNDPTSGQHGPTLNGLPQLFSQNSALATTGIDAQKHPILLPTTSSLYDPTYVRNPTEPNPANRLSSVAQLTTTRPDQADPAKLQALSLPGQNPSSPPGIRFSYEDPQVHVDQDWTVTFEGPLPAFDGTRLATPVVTTDSYQTLLLSNPNALFCRKGVEDHRIGVQRAAVLGAAMSAVGVPSTINIVGADGKSKALGLEARLGDYVQITDDLLDPGDGYWAEQVGAGNDCWDDLASQSPQAKHDSCQQEFGNASDQSPARDFPILEAYEDRLVLGRFGYNGNISTTTREIVGPNASNQRELKRMRCCFHHQVRFRIRTGGMWVAVGTNVGLLHRVTSDDATRACVLSCEPREALLNSRAPAVPWPSAVSPAAAPGRNSPLAMRNPSFSFVVWNGEDGKATVVPDRDLQWKFTTRGQFSPLVVNIASATTAVAPQSMRFIDSLGQLALVDGASQGLVLIDLNTVTLAHTPFF
jgi:hypothetical protein